MRRRLYSPTLPRRIAQAGVELGFLAAAASVIIGWGVLS